MPHFLRWREKGPQVHEHRLLWLSLDFIFLSSVCLSPTTPSALGVTREEEGDGESISGPPHQPLGSSVSTETVPRRIRRQPEPGWCLGCKAGGWGGREVGVRLMQFGILAFLLRSPGRLLEFSELQFPYLCSERHSSSHGCVVKNALVGTKHRVWASVTGPGF